MKYLIFIFAIIAFSFKCSAQKLKKGDQIIVNVLINNKLTERRYFKDSMLISYVYFSRYKKTIQKDSFSFIYNNHELVDVYKYDYNKGHYSKDDNFLYKTYYENLFSSIDSSFEHKYQLKSCYLLRNELYDIETIRNSVLPDGMSVIKLGNIKKQGNGVIISYKNLNSRFSHLSLDQEKYFNNQLLLNVKVFIQDKYLKWESYAYQNGNFNRSYFYKDGRISKILITVTFNDGRTIKECKDYVYLLP